MLNFGFLLETPSNNNPGGSWIMPAILFAILAIFFIFTSRKNKKQEQKEAEQRDNLQVGDEVTTIGGIIGMVVSVKAETFVLETTKDKTKIRFLKAAIRSVDVKAADKAAAILEAKNESTETEAEESK